MIRQDALGSDPTAVETAMERFEREARATAFLRSPHTVELYDFGTAEDGTVYYVMELLEGIDLDRMVREFGPIEPSRVVYLLRQACASLAEAHALGLIHRDIKPANLYSCKQGLDSDVLKVLDFGLVRRTRHRLRSVEPSDSSKCGETQGHRLTASVPELLRKNCELDEYASMLFGSKCSERHDPTGEVVDVRQAIVLDNDVVEDRTDRGFHGLQLIIRGGHISTVKAVWSAGAIWWAAEGSHSSQRVR